MHACMQRRSALHVAMNRVPAMYGLHSVQRSGCGPCGGHAPSVCPDFHRAGWMHGACARLALPGIRPCIAHIAPALPRWAGSPRPHHAWYSPGTEAVPQERVKESMASGRSGGDVAGCAAGCSGADEPVGEGRPDGEGQAAVREARVPRRLARHPAARMAAAGCRASGESCGGPTGVNGRMPVVSLVAHPLQRAAPVAAVALPEASGAGVQGTTGGTPWSSHSRIPRGRCDGCLARGAHLDSVAFR